MARNKAKPSEDELALFRAAVVDAVPLVNDKAHFEPPPRPPIPRSRIDDERAALEESLRAPASLDLALEGGDEAAFLRSGLSRNVLRDLRRGRWVVQDQIDLHGATRELAHELLIGFVAEAIKRDLRCLRVIHGKGLGSPGREPVLKGLVKSWLASRQEVLAYCQARGSDGGAGALIVLLRSTRRR